MDRRRTPKTFPWYKERLQTKSLKDPGKPYVDSSAWRFVKNDLHCPANDAATPIWVPSGPSEDSWPVVFDSASGGRGSRRRISRTQAFSRQSALQETRRGNVADAEREMQRHPLTLYPHYEQAMPQKLFNQVLSILDPEGCKAPTEELDVGTQPDKELARQADGGKDKLPANETHLGLPEPSPKNPYLGLHVRDDRDSEVQKVTQKAPEAPLENEDIKRVVKPLFEWYKLLGGKKDGVTEAYILGLFIRDFEMRPTQETILASHLPEEPRYAVLGSHKKHAKKLLSEAARPNERSTVTKKPKYGVWYLDPKLWNGYDEGDANALPDEFDFLNHQSERDDELKKMYVTQAFMQYILKKGFRVQFMSYLFEEEQETQKKTGPQHPCFDPEGHQGPSAKSKAKISPDA